MYPGVHHKRIYFLIKICSTNIFFFSQRNEWEPFFGTFTKRLFQRDHLFSRSLRLPFREKKKNYSGPPADCPSLLLAPLFLYYGVVLLLLNKKKTSLLPFLPKHPLVLMGTSKNNQLPFPYKKQKSLHDSAFGKNTGGRPCMVIVCEHSIFGQQNMACQKQEQEDTGKDRAALLSVRPILFAAP